MSGTGIAYSATQCYALPGTDLAHAATRSTATTCQPPPPVAILPLFMAAVLLFTRVLLLFTAARLLLSAAMPPFPCAMRLFRAVMRLLGAVMRLLEQGASGSSTLSARARCLPLCSYDMILRYAPTICSYDMLLCSAPTPSLRFYAVGPRYEAKLSAYAICLRVRSTMSGSDIAYDGGGGRRRKAQEEEEESERRSGAKCLTVTRAIPKTAR
eukprot:2437443-Rhodomonas_salina.1